MGTLKRSSGGWTEGREIIPTGMCNIPKAPHQETVYLKVVLNRTIGGHICVQKPIGISARQIQVSLL